MLGSVGEGHLREEQGRRRRSVIIAYAHHFHGLKGKQSSSFLFLPWKRSYITVEEGELRPLNHLYVHRQFSCCRSDQSPALFTACCRGRRRYVTAPVRRARRTGARPESPIIGDRSVHEAQRWRVGVGLDEDGPEDLHVLARARLDVLVQDVDAPLLVLRGMHADPELLERREERLQPRHGLDRRRPVPAAQAPARS